MNPRELKVGEIVQICPDVEGGVRRFGACLMVVAEPNTWGARGYIKTTQGTEWVRVSYPDIEPTGGMAPFTIR